MADIERISISIDRELLQRLDEHVAQAGHGNRSEALRDMIRARLRSELQSDTLVAGSLTVVFDHRKRALAERMIEAAHDHHDIVMSTMHVHLDHDTCMEISALKGTRSELEHYAHHLATMKGVLSGELVISGAAPA
ncbi:MAG: nickel-responsive transcriptional regulator NikR [Myxococcota bacterium]|nr:nickel-responsive transcriptional regulator NikR [Myxococcota bacterium]